MATLEQLIQNVSIAGVFSTVRSPNARISRWLNAQPGGSQTAQNYGRNFSYDIFDHTRKMAQFRAPGSPSGRGNLQPVGNVAGRICRIYEDILIPYERIYNGRALGGPQGSIDKGGLRYIAGQQMTLATRFQNTREFMVSRALRGAFGIKSVGDAWTAVEAGNGDYDIDFRIPAGNKSKLDMLGAGDIIGTSWDNAAAPIFDDLCAINAAFENLHGWPLQHVWISSVGWGYVLANTQVKALGGTSNTPFAQYDRVTETADDGKPVNEMYAVLRGVPWIKWHINDSVLEVDGTNTKFIDDTHAIFTPEPDNDWFEMLEGSEPVVERDGEGVIEPYGLHTWGKTISNPAAMNIFALDNCFPALKVPKCVAYGMIKY